MKDYLRALSSFTGNSGSKYPANYPKDWPSIEECQRLIREDFKRDISFEDRGIAYDRESSTWYFPSPDGFLYEYRIPCSRVLRFPRIPGQYVIIDSDMNTVGTINKDTIKSKIKQFADTTLVNFDVSFWSISSFKKITCNAVSDEMTIDGFAISIINNDETYYSKLQEIQESRQIHGKIEEDAMGRITNAPKFSSATIEAQRKFFSSKKVCSFNDHFLPAMRSIFGHKRVLRNVDEPFSDEYEPVEQPAPKPVEQLSPEPVEQLAPEPEEDEIVQKTPEDFRVTSYTLHDCNVKSFSDGRFHVVSDAFTGSFGLNELKGFIKRYQERDDIGQSWELVQQELKDFTDFSSLTESDARNQIAELNKRIAFCTTGNRKKLLNELKALQTDLLNFSQRADESIKDIGKSVCDFVTDFTKTNWNSYHSQVFKPGFDGLFQEVMTLIKSRKHPRNIFDSLKKLENVVWKMKQLADHQDSMKPVYQARIGRLQAFMNLQYLSCGLNEMLNEMADFEDLAFLHKNLIPTMKLASDRTDFRILLDVSSGTTSEGPYTEQKIMAVYPTKSLMHLLVPANRR